MQLKIQLIYQLILLNYKTVDICLPFWTGKISTYTYCIIDSISLCCKHFLMWQFCRPLWFVWADIWTHTLSPLQNSLCTFCTLCTLSTLQNCFVNTQSTLQTHSVEKPSILKGLILIHFIIGAILLRQFWRPLLFTKLLYTQARMHWAQNSMQCVHWALYKITLCTPQRRIEPFTKLTQPPVLGPWPQPQQCTMHIVQIIHTPNPLNNVHIVHCTLYIHIYLTPASTMYNAHYTLYIHLTPASTRVWGL